MVSQPTFEELAYTVAPDFPLGRKHYRGECYNPAIVSTSKDSWQASTTIRALCSTDCSQLMCSLS